MIGDTLVSQASSINSLLALLEKELIMLLFFLSYSHLLVIQVGSRCTIDYFISKDTLSHIACLSHRVVYFPLNWSLSVSLFISFAGSEATRSYCAVLLSPH